MGRAAVLVAMLGVLAPASAESAPRAASEYSAQSEVRRAPRIQIRPGRLLYRDCKFWLAQEHRPSGTVIVPRQHCWWVRG